MVDIYGGGFQNKWRFLTGKAEHCEARFAYIYMPNNTISESQQQAGFRFLYLVVEQINK